MAVKFVIVFILAVPTANPDNYRQPDFVVHQSAIVHAQSLDCQKQSLGINKNLVGEFFKDDKTQGKIMGTFCDVVRDK